MLGKQAMLRQTNIISNNDSGPWRAHPGVKNYKFCCACAILHFMERWHCPLCHQQFVGKRSVARHLRNVWKTSRDPTRCDSTRRVPLITVPIIPTVTTAPVQATVTTATVNAAPVQATVATATVTVPISFEQTLRSLARRSPFTKKAQRQVRAAYTVHARLPVALTQNCRDFLQVQHEWKMYKQNVCALANATFWNFFKLWF